MYSGGEQFLSGVAEFSDSEKTGANRGIQSGDLAAMTDKSSAARRTRTESRIAIILAIAALCAAMASLAVSLTRSGSSCNCVSDAAMSSGAISSGSESSEQTTGPSGPPGAKGEVGPVGPVGPAGLRGPMGFPGGDGAFNAAFAATRPNCNATGDGVTDDTVALQA